MPILLFIIVHQCSDKLCRGREAMIYIHTNCSVRHSCTHNATASSYICSALCDTVIMFNVHHDFNADNFFAYLTLFILSLLPSSLSRPSSFPFVMRGACTYLMFCFVAFIFHLYLIHLNSISARAPLSLSFLLVVAITHRVSVSVQCFISRFLQHRPSLTLCGRSNAGENNAAETRYHNNMIHTLHKRIRHNR